MERLLKLDPKNTELLAQKQRMLKDAISATSEKLNTLKEAQKQAREQLEHGDLGQDKYDALQREIVATEQELKRLESQAAATSGAVRKISAVGDSLIKVGDAATNAGQKMLPVTAAVGGLGYAAVKTAADFDSAMSQVSAVSGATGDDLQALRDKAREMGEKTKFSASEAAEAMNYMAMAGWKTGDMLYGIDGIMNLAAASGEDLATTSDIVTDALTAFGLSAEDSTHFADILAAASSNANTNVAMMGETFKYCAPIAGALGFSAEDTAEAIGLMANAGIKSTQAGTALRTIMNNLSGELELCGEALGEVTIATTNEDGSMRDLSDILADCRIAFSQLTESEQAQTAEALVGKNAMSGFLALMNAAPADVEKLSRAIADCDGTAENMAAVMQNNLGGQLTILKSQLQELAISFGEILMPVIRKAVVSIQAFVDKLNGMDDSQKQAIIKFALIAASIGPVLIAFGKLCSSAGRILKVGASLIKGTKMLHMAAAGASGVLGKLGAVLSGISAPVAAVIAVIAALTAAFMHLWNTNEGFRQNITATWTQIKETISGFCDGIVERINSLGFEFENITEVLKAVWDGFCSFLAPVFEGAFKYISNVLSTVLDVILGIADFFIAVFHGDWSAAWEAVKNVFITVWNAISSFFTTILTGIKSVASSAWNGIKSLISTAVNAIKTKVVSVFNSVKTSVSTIFNNIKSTATTVWNNIKNAIIRPIEAAKEKVRSALDSIKGFFAGLHLKLPHIDLPHFSLTGSFSIVPPRVPHLSVSWYKEGGIMTAPTIFGMNGSSLMAGGEAGREAILPLSEFYTKLDRMISKRMDTSGIEKYLAVIADNSEKDLYLDGNTLVGKLAPGMNRQLGIIAAQEGYR